MAQLDLGKEQAAVFSRDLRAAVHRLQSALGPPVGEASGGSLAERVATVESELASRHELLLERTAEVERGAAASAARLEGALADLKRSMDERAGFLEREIGESTDEHGRVLQDLLARHEKHARDLADQTYWHATVAERVAFLEQSTASWTAKHTMMLQELRSVGESTHAKGLVDHYDKHAKRVAFLEQWPVKREAFIDQSTGNRAANHDRVLEELWSVSDLQQFNARQVSDCQERLQFIEREMGASFDKHTTALEDLRKVHKGHSRRLGELHATMDERLPCLEKQISDSAHKLLSCLEKQIGDSADRSADALADLRARHEELRASHCQHSSIPERVAHLESELSGGAHERASIGGLAERMDTFERRLVSSADTWELDAKRLQQRLSHCESLVRQGWSGSPPRGDRTWSPLCRHLGSPPRGAATTLQQYVSGRKALATELQSPDSPDHSLRSPLAAEVPPPALDLASPEGRGARDPFGVGGVVRRLASPEHSRLRTPPADKPGGGCLGVPSPAFDPAPTSGAELAALAGRPRLSPDGGALCSPEAWVQGGSTTHEPVVVGEMPDYSGRLPAGWPGQARLHGSGSPTAARQRPPDGTGGSGTPMERPCKRPIANS